MNPLIRSSYCIGRRLGLDGREAAWLGPRVPTFQQPQVHGRVVDNGFNWTSDSTPPPIQRVKVANCPDRGEVALGPLLRYTNTSNAEKELDVYWRNKIRMDPLAWLASSPTMVLIMHTCNDGLAKSASKGPPLFMIHLLYQLKNERCSSKSHYCWVFPAIWQASHCGLTG